MKKFYYAAQDPFSFLSHFVGAIIGVISLVLLIIYNMFNEVTFINILGMYIFVISIIALYSASAFYHYLDKDHSFKLKARKLDHAMIYILIAGSYAPICLTYVDYPHGAYFLVVMFAIALFGIIAKIFWINAPRALYTGLYLLMGWAIVFDASSFDKVPALLLFFIAISGITYTIGAVIYIVKKPNIKILSFHDTFHIFILIGTLIQLVAYSIYIL